MKNLKDVIKKLSLENGVSTHVAEMVVKSQFKLLLQEAAKEELNPVRLIYLGVFGVKPKRKEIILDYRKKYKQRIENEQKREKTASKDDGESNTDSI